MQPTPTPTLLAAASPRLRACTLGLHVALFLALLGLGACRDPKVAAYRVPKDTAAEASKPGQHVHADGTVHVDGDDHADPHAGMAAAPAGMGMGAAAGQGGMQTASGMALSWTAPEAWQSKQASTMRKATYVVTGEGGLTADLAVTAFPGDVGGDVANVNRWRGQLGLAPVNESEALASIERLEVNGLKIGVVDIADKGTPDGAHMLGAIVPVEGATWFFKLVGPGALVSAQKTAFVSFVKTIKPAAPATQ